MMRMYSSVVTSAHCSACDRELSPGIATFTWGAIPEDYQAGDSIRWLRDAGGAIRPSFRLYGDIYHARWNFGDPSMERVIAFHVDPHVDQFQCTHCKTIFPALAVEIHNNRIESARVYSAAETRALFNREPDELLIVEILGDGRYVVHDEWLDPPFDQEVP